MDPRDPYHARRIHDEAELVQSLRSLGAVELRRPRREMGFEKRRERADSTPRAGQGEYIGHLSDPDC